VTTPAYKEEYGLNLQ